jgi:hypothetical protein
MIRFFVVFLLAPFIMQAQRIDLDIFGGMSNYQGDLQFHFFTFDRAKPATAVMLKIGLTNKIYIRTGFSFGSLAASDETNLPKNQPRNLNFKSGLQEYTAGIEYRFLNPDNFRVTPYLFAGVGAFHFDPYTNYNTGTKNENVRLQPLSTEGQGLSMYPDRVPYKLTQFCIPYGAGIKWQINCNLNVGVELRHTKTFTDYIDDVSTTYVNQDALRDARGQIAIDLAWREDEYNGKPYPDSDKPRGNPLEGDLYYFAGVTVGLKLNDCDNGSFSLGGLFNGAHSLFKRNGSSGKGFRRQVGCPKF